jgi:hypothetical protein
MNEYVIVYKADIYRETTIIANNKKEAMDKFRKEVGVYGVCSCELADED